VLFNLIYASYLKFRCVGILYANMYGNWHNDTLIFRQNNTLHFNTHRSKQRCIEGIQINTTLCMVFTMPLVKKKKNRWECISWQNDKKTVCSNVFKNILENMTVQIVETATKTCLKIKLKFNNPSVRAVISFTNAFPGTLSRHVSLKIKSNCYIIQRHNNIIAFLQHLFLTLLNSVKVLKIYMY
jgi:hypothetical protein